jgi:cytochrome c553
MMRSLLTAIMLLLGPATLSAATPTFTKDVAPILWKNCASCHRPGEVGPFPLLSYANVAKRADFLAEVTASRRMPPWKAEPGYGSFHDARLLSDADIATLAAWAKAGAPEGNAADLPAAPRFTEGWQLGEPDLVVSMPEAFSIPAGGRDIYQCFVLPLGLDADQAVSAFEFRPGNRKVVHHAVLFLDNSGQARKKEASEKGPGYRSFGGPGFLPSGSLGAWVPGQTPRHLPDGIGRRLRKGTDLVVQVHYHPSGKPETDRSTVGLYFAKGKAEKFIAAIGLNNRQIDIPPGETNYRRTDATEPLPATVKAIAISPHMHLLGREMKVWAETPEGKTIPLIWIKDWDFNWQGSYHFAEPVTLPKGTIVKLDSSYDNSSGNPSNPNSPPKRVRWGEQTTDEMCLCGIQVTGDSVADLMQVSRMRGNRLGLFLGGDSPEGMARTIKPESLKEILPPGGVPIPDRAKLLLSRYDKDKDGRLTLEEIDAMPPALRNRVKQTIVDRLKEIIGDNE